MAAHNSFMAFDFGLRRIGVATGQRITGTATPLTTVAARGGQPDWTAIEQLVRQWRPDALIVGVPYHMDGGENEMTAAARRFGRQLHGRFGLPVHEVDERLTSVAAEDHQRRQRQAGGRRARSGENDRIAAAIILEDWLSQQQESS